jgi:ABC-2 type transport system ATP-binding protein
VSAVSGLSFSVADGEVLGLLGTNGAGKSVTARMLAGLMIPTSGEFALLGVPNPWRNDPSIRSRVAWLSQTIDYPSGFTAANVLSLCTSLAPQWDVAFQHELQEVFALPLDRSASVLSLGQKLSLALICALCQQARVVMLDEPSGNLDPLARVQLVEAVALALERYSPAFLIATHLLHDFEGVFDRVLMLRQGRALFEATMPDIVEHYRRVRVSFEYAPPADFSLPGALCPVVSERSWEAVLPSAVPEAVARTCDSLNARYELQPISLADLFVEMNRRREQ